MKQSQLKGDIQRILHYIRDCPGCTSMDIIKDLDSNQKCIYNNITRLMRADFIEQLPYKLDGLKTWQVTGRMERQAKPQREMARVKQETVTTWPAVTVPKQGPFSALFLSK